MFGDVPLPLDWPVFVTHDEAQSYADWAGMALPTEAQFHRAAYGTRTGEERQYPWGDEPPDRTRGNFDFQGWDPVPVTSMPAGNSAFGIAQLVGNGWEWTSTVFNPFAGFQAFPFYPGYSEPFFSGGHYVMKGGSARTAARLLRRSFRNWFRPTTGISIPVFDASRTEMSVPSTSATLLSFASDVRAGLSKSGQREPPPSTCTMTSAPLCSRSSRCLNTASHGPMSG